MGLTLWSAAKKVAATIQAIGDRLQTSKSKTGLLDAAKAFSGSLKDQSKQPKTPKPRPPAHQAVIN